jgi:AcrR family transcriptional regulator
MKLSERRLLCQRRSLTSREFTMTTATRRERLRTATVAEIKDLARRLLGSGGPPAISLRAIARDMGMTAPAIYRYFPSLDALVLELTEDLFDELREAVEAARDACTDGAPLPRLTEMARAFRRWSIANPAEFGLMFGNPIPGVAKFEESCFHPDHAGARFGAQFLAEVVRLWEAAPFPTPPVEMLETKLAPSLLRYGAQPGPDVPIQVMYAYLSAWTRLYGLVAMEVFGHLRWAATGVEPLFEVELAAFAAQMSPPPVR